MSTDIEWKDDGFFIHVKARDMVTGEFYWRRAELADCRIIIASLRDPLLLEALKEAREELDALDDDGLVKPGLIAKIDSAIAATRET